MSELKPCPFCGSVNISAVEGSTHRWAYLECQDCGGNRGDWRKVDYSLPASDPVNMGRLIEDWNDRPPPSSVPAPAQKQSEWFKQAMRLAERIEAAGYRRGIDRRPPSDHEPELDALAQHLLAPAQKQMSDEAQDAAMWRWLVAQHNTSNLPIAQVVWKRGDNPKGNWVNLIDGHDLTAHVERALLSSQTERKDQ